MSEREEIVKCVHACMCAVLPATGERVKSKCWYCVLARFAGVRDR